MARGGRARMQIHKRSGSEGGVFFQVPPGWTDGSGKIRHIPSGEHKGRVYFTSRHEAKEIAKRLQDQQEMHIRYDS